MEMCKAFENSVQTNAPLAEIVHDRFHIAKHLNDAVDNVRCSGHRELKKQGDERMAGSKQLGLFHSESISELRQEEVAAL